MGEDKELKNTVRKKRREVQESARRELFRKETECKSEIYTFIY